MTTKTGRGTLATGAGSTARRTLMAGLGATLFAPALRAQPRELRLPISSYSFGTASARLADVLGCYRKHGLDVKIINMDGGSTLTSALVSGSVQVALGGPGELLAANARGQRVLLLTNAYWGMSASLILAKDVADRTGVSPSAPARDRIKALDGLLVASPSATSSYTAAFKGAAEALGARMRFTYMGQPAMAAAIETGVIQGCISGAPLWGAPVSRGKAVVWLSGPKGDLPYENTPASVIGFNAMAPFAEANPGLMRQVLDSYQSFTDMLEASPDQVKAALVKLYPDVEPAAMELLFDAEHTAWKMRQVTPADMRREVDFMRTSGISLPGLDKVDPASMLYVPPKQG